MAGTPRSALHPQRSRLILSAWPVLSTCFRKIMWPTNTFSFGTAKRLRKLRLGSTALTVILIWLGGYPALLIAIRAAIGSIL